MRRFVLIAVAGILIVSCTGGIDDSLTQPETVFHVGVGDRFTIRLESNASTGFTWALKTDPPAGIVTMTSTTYLAPETSLVGAAGVQEFTFEATGPGSASIDLWYIRQFDQPPQPDTEVSFPVTVSD